MSKKQERNFNEILFEHKEFIECSYKQGLNSYAIAKQYLSMYKDMDSVPGMNAERLSSLIRKFCYNKLGLRFNHKPTNTVSDNAIDTNKELAWDSNSNTLTSFRLIKISNEENLTPQRMIELHSLDKSKWRVVSYKNNYWNALAKDGKIVQLFQSKLTVSPIEGAISEKVATEFFDELSRQERNSYVGVNIESNYIAELNIADLHLGRYYNNSATNSHMGIEDTVKVWNNIIEQAIVELNHYKPSAIIFVWSNDFYNSDTITKTTTKGTPQDTETDWDLLFKAGTEMLVNALTAFAELPFVNLVRVIYTPSNHDKMASFYTSQFLNAWFREDTKVSIDCDLSPRKYIQAGNTLIGYSHGEDNMKPQRLASLMSVEQPKLWGECPYREFHIAHLHSEQVSVEDNGVIVRRVSSPTFRDRWTESSGYMGAIRKSQIFLYDSQHGLKNTINLFV